MNDHRRLASRYGAWTPFLLYLCASLVLIGRPVLAHLGSASIGYGPDPSLFAWDLKWWPQAILDGLNPLHVNVAYAPDGFNTALVTSIPGPSIVLAPLTQVVGPLVSYNVLAILIPAIDGWAAFLLCRAAGARYWPSVAGGYAFGFSTYVLGQSLGHPSLSLVATIPLAAYLVLRRVQDAISPRRFLTALTAVLTFQFLISTEVSLTLMMFGTAALALAFALFDQHRDRLLGVAKLIVAAYAIAGILISPYLVSALTANQQLVTIDPIYYSADPLNLAIPTRVTIGGGALHSISQQFTGNLSENGTYIGIPLLIVLALFAWQRRRSRTALFLLGVFGVALIAALGPRLNVLGSPSEIRLPWTLLIHLPIFKYILPNRMIVFAWIALSVAIALWLSSTSPRRWARWALVVVGLAVLLPDPGAVDPSPPHYGASIWSTSRPLPAFFRSGDRPLFRGRPNLLVLPYNEAGGADNLYWQASTGMAYSMPGGYLSGTVPKDFACWPIVIRLRTEDYRRVDRKQLLAFLAAKEVNAVVAPLAVARSAAPLLAALPVKPRRAQGVVIYRVPHARPPGQPRDCP